MPLCARQFVMRRYMSPTVVFRGDQGGSWVRRRSFATPSSLFRYKESRFYLSTSCVDNWCHLRDFVRSDPGHTTRLMRLVLQTRLSSTTTTEINPATHSPDKDDDNDKDKDLSLAGKTLRNLKRHPVGDATDLFFDQCNLKEENFNPHLELTAILETLSDNPQTSEGFLKKLQELANSDASNKVNGNSDESEGVHHQEESFRPSRAHYHMVLEAWLNFAPPSVKRAQALLDYMETNAGMQYETESCNRVLEAWARKGNAERTQKLFDEIIRRRNLVDVVSFSHVLRAWSNSKSPLAVYQAEENLNLMESSVNKPNAECYLRVIECWTKSKRKGAEARIETLIGLLNQRLVNDPDHGKNSTNEEIRQEAVLNLLHVYHNIGNAHRAEEILLEFAKDFETSVGRPPPTIGMCISVLSTWSKSKSSRRDTRAEKLLYLMKNNPAFPEPDTACYTAVINCVASSNKPGSARKAEALLRRMDRKDETQSNLVSLTCVLIAWARSEDSDAPLKAERIFQEILDRGMQPDRYVFAGLITAWGRSNSEDSMLKVEDYFQRLKNLENSTPTVVEYTAVIQAYANYVSRNIDKSRESVQRAEALLTEMLDSEDTQLRPNILTYAAVLKTIAAARRIPDRGERAKSVLRKMLSDKVDVPPYITNLVNRCNSRSPV